MAQYIYGKNTVYDAINSGIKIYEVILLNKSDKIIEKLKRQNIKYKFAQKNEFNQFKGANHQGIAAKIEEYQYCDVKDLFNTSKENNIIVILDQIEDPHNFGAIIRTCDAAGVNGIIIQDKRQVGVTPTVAKVSTGAINHVKIAKVTNIVRTIEELKNNGYWIAGTDANNAQDYRQIDYTGNIALVIGSEGRGIRELVLKSCDLKAFIPMQGSVTSLNASVAAALFIYQAHNSQNPLKK